MKLQAPGNLNSTFVKLKDSGWLGRQRYAGKIAAQTLMLLENLVKDKTTKSLIELDKIANEFITKNGCKCTFLNYKGFPNSVCMSVNRQLVHGICTNYTLQDGDVISFDLGATFEGAIGDTALTCIYGEQKSEEHQKGISATYGALMAGISAAKVGNRLGAIGNAIYKYARDKGFRVIEAYGGHSLEEDKPHAPPFVANRALPNEGIRIVPNLTLAIEPMLVPYNCSIDTKVGSDNWTVYTQNIGFHFEHSIYIHEDSVEIITKRENENA